MISKKYFKLKKNGEPSAKCLCTQPELIENYEKAIADTTQIWHCHHRWETNDPKHFCSKEELIEAGKYYNVPAFDLIFLTNREHIKLHQKLNNSFSGCNHTKETTNNWKKSGRKRGPVTDTEKQMISKRQTGANNTSARKTQCIETGEIFGTVKAAAEKYGVSPEAIEQAVKRSGRSCGLHWRYL